MKRETPCAPNASDKPTLSERNLWTSALILVGAVLLIQVAYYGFSALRRPPGATPVRIELQDADSFYSLEHQRPISLTYQPAVTFSASGAPGEALPLRNYRIEQGQATEAWSREITLDPSGVLTGSAKGLHEGLNLLTVEDQWGEYDGRYIWFLNRGAPYDLTGITRTLEISLTPRQLSATYWATFSPGATDADLDDLLAGRIEATLFLKRVFYSAADEFTGELLANVSAPQVTIGDGVSRVEIQVTARDVQLEPAEFAVLLHMSPPQAPSANLPTTVAVTAGKGVAVRGYAPLPTVAGGRTYRWLGSGSIWLKYDADGELDPFSEPVASTRRMFQQAVEPLWRSLGGPVAILLLAVLLPALLVFPLAWLWRHINGHGTNLKSEADLLPPLESGIGAVVAVLAGFLGGAVLRVTVALLAGGNTGLDLSGAVWAAAVGCATPLALHCYPRVRLRWLWLILSSLLTAAALGLPGHWSALPVALTGALLLLFACWLGCESARPGACLNNYLGSWPRWMRWVGLLLVLVVLAYPVARVPLFYSPLGGWWPATGLSLTMLMLQVMVPFIALLAVLGILRRQGKARMREEEIRKAEEADTWTNALKKIKAHLGDTLDGKTDDLWALDASLLAIGQLLLAYFALGVLRRPLADLKALLPIAPILGWVAFRYLVRQPKELGLAYAERVALASQRLRKTLPQQDQETGEQPHDPPGLELAQGPHQQVPSRDFLFAWPRTDSPWENGKAACVRGAALVAVLLILYGPAILNEASRRLATPFVLLETLVVYLAPFAARWLIYAFILGYFFPYIRGRHGWQKALYLALTIVACTLIQDIVMQAYSVNDVLGLLFEAGQVIVYLSIVGIWAFDLPRIREVGGKGTDLLRSVYGLPFLASYLSALLPALAGVIQSAITGRLSAIVQALVEIVLPTLFQLGQAR